MFEWSTAKESGLAVVVPSDVIKNFKLTAWHFLELIITKIKKADGKEVEVYPGEEKCRKWWPDDKMKMEFHLDFVEP